ncbi:MAG: hypothetical protein JRI23_01825, partial [Deltaproteobacteria bacterium]|nr:hypothetical protein [Deltaproteobacteria bacterium]MBW2530213.1 hypothetical protein [Deltaproteobacteria bacterium]
MQAWLRRRLLTVALAIGGATALVASGSGCDKLVINRFRTVDSAPSMPGSGGTGGTLGLDCIACHISEQNGRRATVLEFPNDTVRAHLSSSPPKSSDCQVCHDVSEHENGEVVLLDPDGNGEYRFVAANELTADPDLSDFCAACHDADGATRLAAPLNPFGGAPAPDVAVKFQGTLRWIEWYGSMFKGFPRTAGTKRAVNSHHDISDDDQQWSGAKIECLSCHGGHVSGATQMISDPDETHKPWRADISTYCLRCHEGGTPQDPGMPAGVVAPTVHVNIDGIPCQQGTPDCDYEVAALRGIEACDYLSQPWIMRYTWSHTQHGPDSKRGWAGYSNAPGADMECTVCHDPHGSYSESNPRGNPYAIRDFVDGTAYVDDGNWETGWLATGPAPPWGPPPAGGAGGAG